MAFGVSNPGWGKREKRGGWTLKCVMAGSLIFFFFFCFLLSLLFPILFFFVL